MSTIDSLVYAARAGIIQLERREAVVLAERYARLANQLAATTAGLATAISEAGPDAAAPGWLERQTLYAQLQRGAGYQMAQVGRFAATRLAAQQATMARRGASDGLKLLRAVGGLGQALEREALAAQIAVANRRLATYDLAVALPQLAVQIIRTSAAKAALLGTGVTGVAARLREGFGGVLNRLLLLSRAEAVTPYRDTTLALFQQNRVASWQWFAEIEQRPAPCGMCVALHGRVFPLADPFATHLGCRCLPVPVLPSAPLPVVIGGNAWFASQDAAIQLQVLGPSKLAHFQAGALPLDALITEEVLPDGRRTRRETTLKTLGLDRVVTPRPAEPTPQGAAS